jgi:hypothetical protein
MPQPNITEGTVLLDNTTVFGARRAYCEWPVQASDWLEGGLALDVRSLMDVLEAVILHDHLALDASSRNEPAWDELTDLGESLGEIAAGTSGVLWEFGREEHIPAIALASLARLERYLGSPELTTDLRSLNEAGIPTLPRLYESTDEFSSLFASSFGIDLNDDFSRDFMSQVEIQLGRVAEQLNAEPSDRRNYALFAFRGFYYQQWAHAHSVSYVPHAWRSRFVNRELSQPSVSFAEYVAGLASGLRRELAQKLNSEFGTTVFSGDFPVIASYVASQTTSRGALLPTALEIRRNPHTAAFRAWTRDIESRIRDDRDLPRIAEAREDLATIIHDLRRELGLAAEPAGQELTIKAGVPLLSVEAPMTVPGLRVPAVLRRVLHRRTHLVFLRDITRRSVDLRPFVTAFASMRP